MSKLAVSGNTTGPEQTKSAKLRSKYAELIKLAELPPSPSPLYPDYKDFLVEAYKKHSTELASIEDRLNRFLLIIFGLFGAGSALIPKAMTYGSAGMLTLVVVALAGFGLHYNFEIREVRAAVRYLLVRCEIEMGFYIPKKDHGKDLPQANKQLYTIDELDYPTKGKFLGATYAAAIIVPAIGFIFLIWYQAK